MSLRRGQKSKAIRRTVTIRIGSPQPTNQSYKSLFSPIPIQLELSSSTSLSDSESSTTSSISLSTRHRSSVSSSSATKLCGEKRNNSTISLSSESTSTDQQTSDNKSSTTSTFPPSTTTTTTTTTTTSSSLSSTLPNTQIISSSNTIETVSSPASNTIRPPTTLLSSSTTTNPLQHIVSNVQGRGAVSNHIKQGLQSQAGTGTPFVDLRCSVLLTGADGRPVLCPGIIMDVYLVSSAQYKIAVEFDHKETLTLVYPCPERRIFLHKKTWQSSTLLAKQNNRIVRVSLSMKDSSEEDDISELDDDSTSSVTSIPHGDTESALSDKVDLHGNLFLDGDTVVISGNWSMGGLDENYTFSYENSHSSDDLSGQYDGSFSYEDALINDQCHLEFTPNGNECYDITGTGTNDFGEFVVQGTCINGIVDMCRVYKDSSSEKEDIYEKKLKKGLITTPELDEEYREAMLWFDNLRQQANKSSYTHADKERLRGATFNPYRKDGDTTPLDKVTAAIIEVATKALEDSPAYDFFPEVAEYLIKYLKCIRPGDTCHFRILLCAVQILRGAFAGAFGCLCNADCKLADNICMRLLKAMEPAFEDSSLVVGEYLENVSGANQDFVCPNPGSGYEHCPAWTIKACVLMGDLYQITFKALLDVGCKVTVHNLSGTGSNVVYFVQSLTPAVTGHENMYINTDTSHIVNLAVACKQWSASFQVEFQRRLYQSIASTLTEASGKPSNLCQLLLENTDAKYFAESAAEIAILDGTFKDTLVSFLCLELYKDNGDVNVFSPEGEDIVGIDIAQTYVKNNLPDLIQMFPDDVRCKEDVTIRQAHALMSGRGRAKALANGNLFGGLSERGRAKSLDTRIKKGTAVPWQQRFDELKAFKGEFNHCNVPKEYATNQSLANWVRTQRKMNKKEEKSDIEMERIRMLTSIGFAWELPVGSKRGRRTKGRKVNGKTWHDWFDELKEYKSANGDCLVPTKTKLGIWVSNQRKMNKKEEKSDIETERIRMLTGIGFDWNPPRTNQYT